MMIHAMKNGESRQSADRYRDVSMVIDETAMHRGLQANLNRANKTVDGLANISSASQTSKTGMEAEKNADKSSKEILSSALASHHTAVMLTPLHNSYIGRNQIGDQNIIEDCHTSNNVL